MGGTACTRCFDGSEELDDVPSFPSEHGVAKLADCSLIDSDPALPSDEKENGAIEHTSEQVVVTPRKESVQEVSIASRLGIRATECSPVEWASRCRRLVSADSLQKPTCNGLPMATRNPLRFSTMGPETEDPTCTMDTMDTMVAECSAAEWANRCHRFAAECPGRIPSTTSRGHIVSSTPKVDTTMIECSPAEWASRCQRIVGACTEHIVSSTPRTDAMKMECNSAEWVARSQRFAVAGAMTSSASSLWSSASSGFKPPVSSSKSSTPAFHSPFSGEEAAALLQDDEPDAEDANDVVLGEEKLLRGFRTHETKDGKEHVG